jgi:hypothetical protein
MMCWTNEEKEVLAKYVDSEQISPPRKLVGEYRFHLGDLAPEIIIKVYASFQDTRVQFEQSHYIKTPDQGGEYITSRPWNDNVGAALNQVIFGFTENYRAAVINGHTPNDSWLVSNPDF